MSTRSLRRTPCIGICSTTYGDLVCRGCKRFAHEIVQWNAFQASQQDIVWQRLYDLRASAFEHLAVITDRDQLTRQAQRLAIDNLAELPFELLAYEVLRRSAAGERSLVALGLSARDGTVSTAALYARIEQEIYQRSVARYEHSFHIPVE